MKHSTIQKTATNSHIEKLSYEHEKYTHTNWYHPTALTAGMGTHHLELTTAGLGHCYGGFRDQPIFRKAWEYYFPRKFKLRFT